VKVRNIHTGEMKSLVLKSGRQLAVPVDLKAQDGWYNLEIDGKDFSRQFSGKYETDAVGWSDPAFT
jgi:hypothetical protein